MPAMYLADDPALPEVLRQRKTLLVVCLCADWCGTCREYLQRFRELALHQPDDSLWIWLDIEDHAQFLEDDEIDDFPTLWIHDGQHLRFFGPMLPHIQQLDDIIQRIRDGRYTAEMPGPDLRTCLQQPY